MDRRFFIALAAAFFLRAVAPAFGQAALLNVSYDPTREFYQEVNAAFTRQWLARCYSLARADGRMCLNIPLDKNKGGQQSVCADITTSLRNSLYTRLISTTSVPLPT